ncbi:hypothetical protein [Streptomyces chrestomyceticus]|uniref:hypothetical protein n=1 Tax=Streptomyces chrestomyceticus TaxID=68185 RepID=UPI0037A847B5
MPVPDHPMILIPGAQHGGWCWRKTLGSLRARGYAPYAVTLTGLGERAVKLVELLDEVCTTEEVIA